MSGNNIDYKRERLVRVIVRRKNGSYQCGTGFFINKEGRFLTCFHVIFGCELKTLRDRHLFDTYQGNDEHSKLLNYFNDITTSIEVEFLDGRKGSAKLQRFNETYDIASLQIENKIKTKFFDVDTEYLPKYDDSVFFCGFQYSVGYEPENYPFATNRGVVSSFPEIVVAGDKYPHIQLNSINLGGNSGAPLLHDSRDTENGVVNGNMDWGGDNVAFINTIDEVSQTVPGTLRVPLSIAFATSLKTVNDETNLFG